MTLQARLFSVFLGIILLAGAGAAQTPSRDEGINLFRAQKFSEAVIKLQAAAAADPADRQAWLYLAATYKHLDQGTEAEKAFKSSMLIQKTNLPKFDKAVKITRKPLPKPNVVVNGSETYVVAVELRYDGTVGVVIPYSASPGNNMETAVYAAKKVEFEPAVQDGKPVSVVQVLEYKFTRY